MAPTPLKRRFIQCDVFSPVPTQGNGLAVIVEAEGLSDEQFRLFAAWTNLAETTFMLPPEDPVADYKLRIFTPTREMPFAGHPTLGSCAAWLHAGGVPKQDGLVRQECGVGIVDIDVSGSSFAFVAPPTKIEPLPDQALQAITKALEIPPGSVKHTALLDNGPVWQVLQLETAAQVLALDSSRVKWPEFKSIGLIGAHPPGSECDFEVRMLAPSSGMSEDPITGSLNAALAHWLYAEGRLSSAITVGQGTNINRHGRVSIRPDVDTDKIFIGGDTHIIIDGHVTL
ncbi:MAG: PhzF family phenazine biosynthesis protein [Gammaproteobacteria bacterium]|nr:MAG: PhzF family phenazine biosynthesis protein [Gammaproteobacteria bacterium]